MRDNVGDVLMSVGMRRMALMDAKQLEAEAIRFGLDYVFDAGLRAIVMETDCLHLVNMLRTKMRERTGTQVIVDDILAKSIYFDVISFAIARRNCNKVAHSLDKASLHFEEVKVWMEDSPPEVLPHVLHDKALIN